MTITVHWSDRGLSKPVVFLLKVYLSDCEGGKDLSSIGLIIMLGDCCVLFGDRGD